MRSLIIFLCFIYSVVLTAQDYTIKQDTIIAPKDSSKFIGLDYFNNSYFIKDQTFIKQNKNNKWYYTNVLLGNITSIDVRNPSEIVIFYKDFNTIVIIDSRLNTLDTLKFDNKTVIFATKASVDRLWIYNANAKKIELYNYKTEKVEVSSTVFLDKTPLLFKSDFNHVYVYTQDQTFLVFDSFLSSKVISEKILIDDFEINNNQIVIKKENAFFIFTKKGVQKITQVNANSNTSFHLKDTILYIFDGNRILLTNVPKFD